MIGSFPNDIAVYQRHDEYFTISNTFHTGIFELQFQQCNNNTGPIYSNPQPLIGNNTRGVVSFKLNF